MVFVNRQGDLLKYNAVQSAFNGGFEALGLPGRSSHICRHAYATLAMMVTGDIGSVQALQGRMLGMADVIAGNVTEYQLGDRKRLDRLKK